MWKILASGLAVLCLIPLPSVAHNTQDHLALQLGWQCVAEVSLAPRLQVPRAQRIRQKVSECRMMWHVLGAKVDYRPADLYELVPSYTALWRRVETSRAWIFSLEPLGRQPIGWPDKLSWPVYQPMWDLVYAKAQAFVDEPGRHPCPAANHFGGRCDDTDHACDTPPSCWSRQWCGKPPNWWSQAYWHRPGPCPATIPATVAAGTP